MKLLRNQIIFLYSSLFLFLILISGCINLKSVYPEIQYYRLSQEAGILQNLNTGTIKGNLQIRNFTIGAELETEHLLALVDENKLQVYQYHRWISDINDLITDFFVTRWNSYNFFSGAVLKSSTMIIPDYILEGHVLDMFAHNNKDNVKDGNFVYISLRVTLLKRIPLSTDRNIVINKVYTNKTLRESSSVNTLAPTYSKCISEIADKMLYEIQEAIAKDRIIN